MPVSQPETTKSLPEQEVTNSDAVSVARDNTPKRISNPTMGVDFVLFKVSDSKKTTEELIEYALSTSKNNICL